MQSFVRGSHCSRLAALCAGVLAGFAPTARAVAATSPGPRVVYTSPHAGARYVHPETNILVRFDRDPGSGALPGLVVTGARSGAHAGRLRLADDGRTLVFAPARAFDPGEPVEVTVAGTSADAAGSAARFAFTTAAAAPALGGAALAAARDAALDPLARLLGASARPLSAAGPSDTLPLGLPFVASALYGTPAPGRIFMASFATSLAPATPYLLVLDDSGAPLFYREMSGVCTDFKVQPDGRLTYFDGHAGKFFAMDSSYTVVDSFACGNGYATDVHELRLLPNGHALLIGDDPESIDMSGAVAGGNSAATVLGIVVQELDANKDVVFEWRSLDHFAITDATEEDLTAPAIDYAHTNAIEPDTDGNLLISSRNMDEITKLDRTTGEILWRWGGKNNQFTLVGDDLPFSHQHAIRRLPNGHVTLFDNGDFHAPPFSRALEFALDESTKTATLVWQFRNVPDSFASAMGYVQRLDNGSTLIGWGTGKPDAIEVAADGSKVMELRLPPGQSSYRVFREAWSPEDAGVTSVPPPRLALSVGAPNPSRGQAVLYLSLAAPSQLSVEVVDVRGRLVRRLLDGVPRLAGVYRVVVDLAGVPAGVYFAHAATAAGTVSQRLVHLN